MIKVSVISVIFAMLAVACSPSERLSDRVMSHTITEDGSGRLVTKSGAHAVVGSDGLTFSFDPGVGPELRAACRSAALTLNVAVGQELIQFDEKDRSFGGKDKHNTISYLKTDLVKGPRQVAQTATYANDYGITESDIDFGRRLVTSGVDAESICLHEFGHSIGFAHVLDRTSIMYESLTAGRTKRTLSPSDLERLRAAYPAAPLPKEG